MHEFTGERVIPGLVDADLFNEHLSRYRFAARFAAPEMAVLDAGCGAGYGSAEFNARAVAAIDLSPEAVVHAATHYARPGAFFAAASCAALPFRDAAFDLVVSFEVIEHLPDYRALLSEARRVLKSGGVFLVSTPNRAYYAESRAQAGPNPFHVREFDYAEFTQILAGFFPHVEIWTQNHTDAIVFSPASPAPISTKAPALESSASADPQTAHFFLAACSSQPIASRPLFAWLPSAANTLRERELHIARLAAELATKDAWLNDALARHESLHRAHQELLSELERRSQWAGHLNHEIAQRDARIAELQQEAAVRLTWVRDLEDQIARGGAQIETLNAELIERAKWAQSLEAEIESLSHTRWMRLGKKLHALPHAESPGEHAE
ncbi:MAG TPA: methyltransferase domain-containing protein [Rhizomicrobium sp.]|nr:methyltransferase domain-containing protein [Rhizomicrobium sp.]